MLRIILPKSVKLIIDILEKNGFEAYAVGGCVRDAMLGREPQDWDITTNALPFQVKELFTRTIDTGIQHGTVTVMMNHIGYEVTTYRIDGEYEDGRHPNDVEFTSNLVEDLKRRDFTINAMAYNDRTGLVDEFDGIGDLQRKVIRCVGNPEDRFNEDALRIMRAVRFAAQLGFGIEENTRNAIVKLAENLKMISKERIHTELIKLLVSKNPQMILEMYNTGITGYILPEFDDMMNTPQNSIYHIYNVGEHTIKVLTSIEDNQYLRWAALLHDVGKPSTRTTDEKGIDHFHGHEEIGSEIARKILKNLKMDNKTIDIVTRLVRYHDYPLTDGKKSIRRSMNKVGEDIYPMFLKLKRADIEGKSPLSIEKNIPILQNAELLYEEICRANECVTIRNLDISGKDLLELGILRGEMVGKTLEKLLEIVLDEPEKNKKEILLEEAKKYL
ncbi:MAG: CCA tRNA nucleotidyltransferase [Lachnospiraceae bacterium]|nr:CCA tRNA nucleotidyltransferase [Lachnospiraceae bacterium]MBQ4069274.1 CCA tRNA nucleotidyltransferase [Lachnospiraceae bacterium]